MTGLRARRGFTNLYFVPQGQTSTANYYINKILNEEVKPLISRRSTVEVPVKIILFSYNRRMSSFKMEHRLTQSRLPRHGAGETHPILSKQMSGLLIYRTLIQWIISGALLTRLHNNCLANRPSKVQQGRSSTRSDRKHV